ncbi:SUMF1/EgtB/PvdOfamily nonheme iron enzyme [Aliidiomarina halalkaliphila]|uniref:SUMF1/EgtB/PvdOfamily nonheme iron enzyme n=1 Tax=Aliidiomarina halalkaliphila TaxID=2593535 RepID=A0A552X0W8_9GAMM|nr:SUMF1/EgtB/PvdO family nonheme iron enzyme [Aliidiomarina halalkaliphila]TRW48687.1 SUMF1/EgtB/PvdOfamily nonheme iron enzyme [Aliidiomarina halalkaliphila]
MNASNDKQNPNAPEQEQSENRGGETETPPKRHAIDDGIDSGIKKHRLFVVLSAAIMAVLLLLYLSWITLLEGYAIVIGPEDAHPHATVERVSGIGFVAGTTVYTLGGSLEIEASAPLYYSQRVQLNQQSPPRIDILLEPLPAQLTATTEPALVDGEWRIDGTYRFTGAIAEFELPEGTYELTFSHPFFHDTSTIIEADKGAELNHTFALEPILGRLEIASSPAGARVTINGEEAGVTPLQLDRVGGEYEVVVRAEGYEPIVDTLTVRQQRPVDQRNYQLDLLKATLVANVTPSGGVLVVNDQPVSNPARVNANESLRVRYEKAGYQSQEQTLRLAPDSRETVQFRLEPEMGQVRITANKPAQVWINGQLQGTTPLTLTLQALPQQIEFRREYYRSQRVSVTPSAATTRAVHGELMEEFDARRAENKPLFANTIGIQLLPVQPSSFTMGSPMTETGRLRNEIQRPVSFTRNFWVSEKHITEGQFARFRNAGDTESTLPVTNVSWLDAARFTNWLSEQEGLIPFYIIQNNALVGVRQESRGYRLPSEAEWEFIAKHYRRAARTTYVWGNQSNLREGIANFADEALRGEQTFVLANYKDSHKDLAPVGSYAADRNGFYDLDGNVREWVHDRYGLIPASPPALADAKTDYLGPDSGRGNVVKGASYLTGQAHLLRASVRYQGTEPEGDIGFRIARYHD